MYIWQKSWDEDIQDSIKQVASQSDNFSILAATISVSRGRPVISKVATKLAYLKDISKPVILAIRMLSSCGGLVNSDKVGLFTDEVSLAIQALIDEADKANVTVAGVQFDYDSPTSKLKYYRQFLLSIQSQYPELPISITILPTWMDSSAFQDLVKPLAFYVLRCF